MSAQIVSFDVEKASRYIERVFKGYLMDPADTDFQKGYLAALLDLYTEGLGKGLDDDRITILQRQTRHD
ncbi:hypothetical protein [Alteraurantiacibacter buctensis]|uniref:Uncharacterized protein n=1 Tax=Alteraurantiacibacter buctensis TaxID=1503981 RepID=A0A844YZB5_9SPHN|nr:hypothetical protein [Alteraurantiacibacter buctensis]MXO72899.1 hypothetical protein [Alteraurantiacibacter buctensis]